MKDGIVLFTIVLLAMTVLIQSNRKERPAKTDGQIEYEYYEKKYKDGKVLSTAVYIGKTQVYTVRGAIKHYITTNEPGYNSFFIVPDCFPDVYSREIRFRKNEQCVINETLK